MESCPVAGAGVEGCAQRRPRWAAEARSEGVVHKRTRALLQVAESWAAQNPQLAVLREPVPTRAVHRRSCAVLQVPALKAVQIRGCAVLREPVPTRAVHKRSRVAGVGVEGRAHLRRCRAARACVEGCAQVEEPIASGTSVAALWMSVGFGCTLVVALGRAVACSMRGLWAGGSGLRA